MELDRRDGMSEPAAVVTARMVTAGYRLAAGKTTGRCPGDAWPSDTQGSPPGFSVGTHMKAGCALCFGVRGSPLVRLARSTCEAWCRFSSDFVGLIV